MNLTFVSTSVTGTPSERDRKETVFRDGDDVRASGSGEVRCVDGGESASDDDDDKTSVFHNEGELHEQQ